MSHIETKDLSKQIDFIRKYSKVPILLIRRVLKLGPRQIKKNFLDSANN